MKELTGSAVNIVYAEGAEGKLRALAEIIIVRSEPAYSVDAAGVLVKQRVVDEVRFSSTASGLREMAKRFLGFAKDMERAEKVLKDTDMRASKHA
jgi:hypothetical protein